MHIKSLFFAYHLDQLVKCLHQSFAGTPDEIHEAERVLLSTDITTNFCSALFLVIKQTNTAAPIKSAALIQIIRIVKTQWNASLSPEIKNHIMSIYFQLLFSHGQSFGKLFQYFSNLIVDAVLTFNHCPELTSKIILDHDHFSGSLILIKSISRHLNKNNDNSQSFDNFIAFFFQSTFPFLELSQSNIEIKLLTDCFNYLITIDIEKSKQINKTAFILIFNKFLALKNLKGGEDQKALKSLLKSLYFLICKELIEPSSELILSFFTASIQLFSNTTLNYHTRIELTKCILCGIRNEAVSQFFILNQQTILDHYFLPIYLPHLNQLNIFEKQTSFFRPIDFAIDIIQCISENLSEFKYFLNGQYIFNAFKEYQETFEQHKQAEAILYGRICIAASSLQLVNQQLLQMELFENSNSIIRIVQFTISANFFDLELICQLFPVFISHISDDLPIVSQLSAITALKCLQTDSSFLQNFEMAGFSIEFLYEAFLNLLSTTSIPITTSMKLLKKLLLISGNPRGFTKPIFEFLISQFLNCISNSENSLFLYKIVKRMRQLIQCCSESEEIIIVSSFIHELIQIYPNLNEFLQEQLLNVFEVSALFSFSPGLWEIVVVFKYELLFADEMMAFHKLLVSTSQIHFFNSELLKGVFEKLLLKIDDSFDAEIAFHSIADILFSLSSHDDFSILTNEICGQIAPIIIHFLSIDQGPGVGDSIAHLISALFASSNTDEYFIPPFLDFWIANAQFPYFNASSINVLQKQISEFELILTIFQKFCDEITKCEPFEDDSTFPQLTFHDIVMNLLLFLKQLEKKEPEISQKLYQTFTDFFQETLPEIVDQLCVESE